MLGNFSVDSAILPGRGNCRGRNRLAGRGWRWLDSPLPGLAACETPPPGPFAKGGVSMTARKVLAFVPALLALAGVFPVPGPAAPVPPTKPAKVRLAFVHAGKDVKGAADFKKLLEGAGFAVDLVGTRDVAKQDFAPYAAVLIGPDTENDWRAGLPNWRAPPAVADPISRSGKP